MGDGGFWGEIISLLRIMKLCDELYRAYPRLEISCPVTVFSTPYIIHKYSLYAPLIEYLLSDRFDINRPTTMLTYVDIFVGQQTFRDLTTRLT